jgi:hypothetical protein
MLIKASEVKQTPSMPELPGTPGGKNNPIKVESSPVDEKS